MVLFNQSDKTYSKIGVDPGNEASLSMKNIRHIYRDEGNVMWLGTGGMGLDKYVESP